MRSAARIERHRQPGSTLSRRSIVAGATFNNGAAVTFSSLRVVLAAATRSGSAGFSSRPHGVPWAAQLNRGARSPLPIQRLPRPRLDHPRSTPGESADVKMEGV